MPRSAGIVEQGSQTLEGDECLKTMLDRRSPKLEVPCFCDDPFDEISVIWSNMLFDATAHLLLGPLFFLTG